MVDIVEIYLETGDFHEAVKQSGLPTHIAHLKLIKSGCLKIQDKIQYGSRTAKLGGMAEELFQKYVPSAIKEKRELSSLAIEDKRKSRFYCRLFRTRKWFRVRRTKYLIDSHAIY
jgi:hypothetical protein